MEASHQIQNPTKIIEAIKTVATNLGFKTNESYRDYSSLNYQFFPASFTLRDKIRKMEVLREAIRVNSQGNATAEFRNLYVEVVSLIAVSTQMSPASIEEMIAAEVLLIDEELTKRPTYFVYVMIVGFALVGFIFVTLLTNTETVKPPIEHKIQPE